MEKGHQFLPVFQMTKKSDEVLQWSSVRKVHKTITQKIELEDNTVELYFGSLSELPMFFYIIGAGVILKTQKGCVEKIDCFSSVMMQKLHSILTAQYGSC